MSSFYNQHPNFLKEVKGNALSIDFNRNSEVEQYCIVCVYVQHESPYLPMIGYCLWAGEGESLRGRPSISAPFTRSSACASKAQEVSRTLIHKNERTFMKAAPIRCSSEREVGGGRRSGIQGPDCVRRMGLYSVWVEQRRLDFPLLEAPWTNTGKLINKVTYWNPIDQLFISMPRFLLQCNEICVHKSNMCNSCFWHCSNAVFTQFSDYERATLTRTQITDRTFTRLYFTFTIIDIIRKPRNQLHIYH